MNRKDSLDLRNILKSLVGCVSRLLLQKVPRMAQAHRVIRSRLHADSLVVLYIRPFVLSVTFIYPN